MLDERALLLLLWDRRRRTEFLGLSGMRTNREYEKLLRWVRTSGTVANADGDPETNTDADTETDGDSETDSNTYPQPDASTQLAHDNAVVSQRMSSTANHLLQPALSS